jgi:MFS family permease
VGGRLADGRGRRSVVVAGLLLAALGGALYFVPAGVPGLVLARLVLGVGDGWVFTAGATWIVDLAPEERRGQAIGIFGLSIWGGLTFGSLIGEGVYALGGYDAVWAFATVAPVAGLLVSRMIPPGVPHGRASSERVAEAESGMRSEPDISDERPTPPLAVATVAARPAAPTAVAARAVPEPITVRGSGLGRFIPAVAVPPGIALALANVGYGTMAGFVVLLLDDRGIDSGASVFTAFAGSVVVSRLLFAKLPDQIGPRLSAFGAGIAQAVGCAMVGAAHTLPMALLGAVVMGTGMSLLFPSLALLVTRRVDDARRGAALGSFTAFFDLGVGLGAPFAGIIASLGAGENYAAAFYAAALCCLAGAFIGFVSSRKVPEAMA